MIGQGPLNPLHQTPDPQVCPLWDRLGSWTVSGGRFSPSSPSALLPQIHWSQCTWRTERAEKEGVCEFKMYAVFERMSKSILVFKDKMHEWEHTTGPRVISTKLS